MTSMMRAQQNFLMRMSKDASSNKLKDWRQLMPKRCRARSVEDDFVIDENAEDVDEETVETIVAGKKESA